MKILKKTCQFGLTDPEGPKDRDLDPGLKLVWSISTKARAHASNEGTREFTSRERVPVLPTFATYNSSMINLLITYFLIYQACALPSL